MPYKIGLTPKEIAVMEDQAVAEGRMPALTIRKGLLEKIRADHKGLRRASNSEILRQLMYGRVKYPKGFSAEDIYVHPGKDATDEEWDEYFDWMMKGKSVRNTMPRTKKRPLPSQRARQALDGLELINITHGLGKYRRFDDRMVKNTHSRKKRL